MVWVVGVLEQRFEVCYRPKWLRSNIQVKSQPRKTEQTSLVAANKSRPLNRVIEAGNAVPPDLCEHGCKRLRVAGDEN